MKNPVTGEAIDLSDIKVGRFRLREGGEIGSIYAEERLKRDQDGYIVYNEGQNITTELQFNVRQCIYGNRYEAGQLSKRDIGQLVYVGLFYRWHCNNLAQRERSAL